jgi:hypothetical protein
MTWFVVGGMIRHIGERVGQPARTPASHGTAQPSRFPARPEGEAEDEFCRWTAPTMARCKR